MRMPLDGLERQSRWAGLAHSPNNAAMATRGHITPRAGIGLLHLARREEQLILNDHNAHAVPATTIAPDAWHDVVNRVNDVAVAIIADCPVSALRGIAHAGHGRIDEQVE